MMLIKCPSCGVETENRVTLCPVCGYRPENIDGFDAWAPELAQSGLGEFFHLESFQKLAALEDANFWFQARNELILWSLNQYFAKPKHYAEIGCGTGYVLQAVEQALPETAIVGTELFVEGLKFAAQRCKRAKLVQLDARAIPYRNQFDVVGIFDVLEHIEDDEAVLNQIEKSLVYGGGVLIIVDPDF